MPSVFVTLFGGSPWGFRIEGGRGTDKPLRLSKVNPGSKASYHGLKEGDLLKMVNGYPTERLSQMDVQNIIKETGVSLTLEVERNAANENSERVFTSSKTLMLNGMQNSNKRSETNINGSTQGQPSSNSYGLQNGSTDILSNQKGHTSSLPNGKNENNHSYGTTLTFSPNTIVTDQPPPPGAVLLDKKVTIDGDKVHTDKYYAIPVQEVLKEKTTTTKFIPAPPKYEGIGPTEDGIPIAPRNSVKKENMHNWYKTMFKSLHKADTSNDTQEYIIGYSSEPETSKRDKILKKKSVTLDNRLRYDNASRSNSNLNKQDYPPAAKSSIEVYNVRPRLIEDYEPGHSSVTDDMITTGSRRFLPSTNVPKPFYEFKNGYESDSSILKKAVQPETLNSEQQKVWYRRVQQGSDIPQFGLGKPAPVKPKEPSIGPMPPPPLNYSVQPTYQQAKRPPTLPADYANQNGNGVCQQMNGIYEAQVRQALHTEMHQLLSPSSYQMSPPIRSSVKSPSRSPDLKLPARALFDFKAESPKEIPLKKGDLVLVLRQLDKNWYEGEHNGVIGIFPISYIEIVPPEYASTPIKMTESTGKTLYDFTAQTPIELTVKKGDLISVIRRVDANWYEARFNNRKGIIPVSYVQIMQESFDRILGSPSPKSYSSSPRSTSEMKEKVHKTNSNSPSLYSASTPSPQTVTNEKGILQNRYKKGSSLIEPVLYRALFSYAPQNADELELMEGDTVYVVEMCDDGWYVGTSVRTGVFGIFPGNYVEKV